MHGLRFVSFGWCKGRAGSYRYRILGMADKQDPTCSASPLAPHRSGLSTWERSGPDTVFIGEVTTRHSVDRVPCFDRPSCRCWRKTVMPERPRVQRASDRGLSRTVLYEGNGFAGCRDRFTCRSGARSSTSLIGRTAGRNRHRSGARVPVDTFGRRGVRRGGCRHTHRHSRKSGVIPIERQRTPK